MASRPNRLRALFERGVPALAASWADDLTPDALAVARDTGLDVAELRIDRYASLETDHVVRQVAALSETGSAGTSGGSDESDGPALLATIRWAGEGGDTDLSHAERAVLYDAVLPHVDGIDIELAALTESPELADVVQRARELGVVVIVSTHDFESLPDDEALEDVWRRSVEAGADVTKIAAMVHDDPGMRKLAAFTLRHAEDGVIVIAMGEHGTKSRVFFPALGSLLTFSTAPGAPVVSGQLSFDEMAAELARFYPAR